MCTLDGMSMLTSSSTNSTPPMGAENATATPAAQAQERISLNRLSSRLLLYVTMSIGTETTTENNSPRGTRPQQQRKGKKEEKAAETSEKKPELF